MILRPLLAFILTGVMLTMSTTAPAAIDAPPSDAEGFAFLEGKWLVHNKKLKEPLSGRTEWSEFKMNARFFTLLDGLVSVEELRDDKGAPFGSATRTFDRAKRTWADHWLSARNGILNPPAHGRFEKGVADFISPDTFEGKDILVRGQWRRVSANEVIWEQSASVDKGKTWELNWHMTFKKVE